MLDNPCFQFLQLYTLLLYFLAIFSLKITLVATAYSEDIITCHDSLSDREINVQYSSIESTTLFFALSS